MKNIKFTLLIKVLLGNLANVYELGSGGFENQTTSNMQENQIGRSRILGRKNSNPTYRFSPGGISKGVFNRSPTPRPPVAGSVPRPTKTCNNVDLSANSLFEDSSPCRLNCRRANIKCDICKKRRGRQKEICLAQAFLQVADRLEVTPKFQNILISFEILFTSIDEIWWTRAAWKTIETLRTKTFTELTVTYSKWHCKTIVIKYLFIRKNALRNCNKGIDLFKNHRKNLYRR